MMLAGLPMTPPDEDDESAQFNLTESFFISEQLACVRWRPYELGEFPCHFVTGSMYDRRSKITLWEYEYDGPKGGMISGFTDLEEDPYPKELSEYPTVGGVTKLHFISTNLLLLSTNAGSLFTLRLKDDDFSFHSVAKFSNYHSFRIGEPAPCLGFDIVDNYVASFGDDGKIVYFCIDHEAPVGIMQDSTESLKCISFLKQNEIITGNMRGQMKLWDVRKNPLKPVVMFPHTKSKSVYSACVCTYPQKPHIMVVAGGDGAVSVWDIRKGYVPVQIFEAHKSAVSTMQFHPVRPSNFFSTSILGEVFRWGNFDEVADHASAPEHLPRDMQPRPTPFDIGGDNPIPISGFDVCMDRLLYTSDNSSFTIIKRLRL